MTGRFSRNIGALTDSEQLLLADKHVFIAGAGGLGGYLFSYLLRLGVGEITIIDSDVFDITNLNRQLLSSEENIGTPKAKAADTYGNAVNSAAKVNAIQALLTEENCCELIDGCDLVMDGLDNIEGRRILSAGCDSLGIPYVYGGICGWTAQAGFFPSGKARGRISILYPEGCELKDRSNLSFTPALCASLQVCEAVKYLTGRDVSLGDKILCIDFRNMEFQEIPFP